MDKEVLQPKRARDHQIMRKPDPRYRAGAP
jgi:hypothetical protein